MFNLATRFAGRLTATGVASLLDVTSLDCDGFVWAPTKRNVAPSLHTVHLRRTALRGLFSTLSECEPGWADPSRDLVLPARDGRRARPLLDAEITLVRSAAMGRRRSRYRAAAAFALAEATATTGEIAQVRWCHINVKKGTVELPGASPVRPRTGRLSQWGVSVLGDLARRKKPSSTDWVVARRSEYEDAHSAQATMANLLTKVCVAGGVRGTDVRPTSIRLWGGVQVLRGEGIEAAAAALGISSLDACARALRDAKGRR